MERRGPGGRGGKSGKEVGYSGAIYLEGGGPGDLPGAGSPSTPPPMPCGISRTRAARHRQFLIIFAWLLLPNAPALMETITTVFVLHWNHYLRPVGRKIEIQPVGFNHTPDNRGKRCTRESEKAIWNVPLDYESSRDAKEPGKLFRPAKASSLK